MTTIRHLMTEDHRHCDDLFAAVEQAVARKSVADARAAFDRFKAAILAHFDGEERTLFPQFEASTGIVNGPTRMMRMEHAQIRSLLEESEEALAAEDLKGYLALADTVLIMMQQHNMKEENVLYPMCDHHLSPQANEIVAALEEGLMGHAAP